MVCIPKYLYTAVSQEDGTLPGDKVVSFCNLRPFRVPHIPCQSKLGTETYAVHTALTVNVSDTKRENLFVLNDATGLNIINYLQICAVPGCPVYLVHSSSAAAPAYKPFWLVPPSWVFVSPSFPWLTYVSSASWNVFVN